MLVIRGPRAVRISIVGFKSSNMIEGNGKGFIETITMNAIVLMEQFSQGYLLKPGQIL